MVRVVFGIRCKICVFVRNLLVCWTRIVTVSVFLFVLSSFKRHFPERWSKTTIAWTLKNEVKLIDIDAKIETNLSRHQALWWWVIKKIDGNCAGELYRPPSSILFTFRQKKWKLNEKRIFIQQQQTRQKAKNNNNNNE